MDTDVERRNCSFCGVRGRRGVPFAGGFGAMICEDCVDRFHAMFHDPDDLAAATRPPWDQMSDTELLTKLPTIADSARQVDDFLVQWVGLCRDRRLSWAAIGTALGTSRQAAWERFSRRVEALGSASSSA